MYYLFALSQSYCLVKNTTVPSSVRVSESEKKGPEKRRRRRRRRIRSRKKQPQLHEESSKLRDIFSLLSSFSLLPLAAKLNTGLNASRRVKVADAPANAYGDAIGKSASKGLVVTQAALACLVNQCKG